MRLFGIELPLFIALMVSWVHGQECSDVELTANSGTFTSPNFPNYYGHKLNCSWTITAPANHFIQLSFVNFDLKSPFLQCSHDNVTVYKVADAPVVFCNNKRPPEAGLKSVANSLRITLKTDDFFRNGNGFKATYNIVDKDGNPLDKPDVENTEDETTVTTTIKTTTSVKKTRKVALSTSSALVTKMFTETIPKEEQSDAGKTSGFVIGAVVVLVVVVVCVVCSIAFVRFRKNRNKRISLNVIATPDDKELINNGKIYKKIGNKIVKGPETETFPL